MFEDVAVVKLQQRLWPWQLKRMMEIPMLFVGKPKEECQATADLGVYQANVMFFVAPKSCYRHELLPLEEKKSRLPCFGIPILF